MKLENPFKNFRFFDWALWIFSVVSVLISFFVCKSTDYSTLATSLLGVSALIFIAKGNPLGLVIMLAFSAVYAVVSFFFRYYGEMIIYLTMQIPSSFVSLINWIRHPSENGSSETKVGKLNLKIFGLMIISTAAVTTAFYFILRVLGTENLIVSTISVATSFSALFLMMFRIPAYAAAFMLNDIVLIVLWSFACAQSLNYVAMVVCFSIFLLNDLNGFIRWTMRARRQKEAENNE